MSWGVKKQLVIFVNSFRCHLSVCVANSISAASARLTRLTISIRAHGRESSLGVLWWRSWRQMQWCSMMFMTIMCLHCCLSDKVLPQMPVLPLSHLLNSRCRTECEDRKGKTHREVSVEVVFPVKKWLLVYGAVESQSCHHCCLDTSFVQDLGTQRGITWRESKKTTDYLCLNYVKQHLRVMCQVRMHQRMTPGSLEVLRSQLMSQRTAWC